MLHIGRQNQTWATGGQGGYVLPTALKAPNAADQGTRSGGVPQVALVGYITPAA